MVGEVDDGRERRRGRRFRHSGARGEGVGARVGRADGGDPGGGAAGGGGAGRDGPVGPRAGGEWRSPPRRRWGDGGDPGGGAAGGVESGRHGPFGPRLAGKCSPLPGRRWRGCVRITDAGTVAPWRRSPRSGGRSTPGESPGESPRMEWSGLST